MTLEVMYWEKSCSNWVFRQVSTVLFTFTGTYCDLVEHATALCRSYSDKKESIRSVLKDQSFRLSKLKDASVEWKQGVTGDKYSVQLPYAELCLKVERSCVKNTDVLCFTEDRLDEFLDQLKHIRDLMTADQ